ncbi:MAG: DUF3291 domain-containing protein [Flavobacteriales bacterium]|nr:DUF3291 domain-containing protein [Flavobacteriales bacterium]
MKATITSIELRGPLKFFVLSSEALKIIRQLKTTNCVKTKTRGFWTKHYTMTLWKNEEEMKAFAYSGAHMEAMKKSKAIAKEIRILTIDATELPNWKEAKELLKGGKILRY